MKPKRNVRLEGGHAIIYCRVSTDEQSVSGLGLSDQERRCRAWAEAMGYDVAGVFVDAGASAKNLKRPELNQALQALKPGNVLLALKVDRLTRNLADFPVLHEIVEKAGAHLATVEENFDTSTATGRAMLHIVLVFSQLERELIGERTAAALAEKRARGERLGTTPYGYRTDPDGTLVAVEAEQATVTYVREQRAAGDSLHAIARELNEKGSRTKRGCLWAAESVRRLVTPRYVETLEGASR